MTKRFVQLLLIAGIGGCVGAGEPSPPTSAELLERVITETQSGNFESAWAAYEAFFAHPRRNLVDVDTFGRCFYWQRCPGVGLLGALLDKTPQDAAGFWSFCPDWSSMYLDEAPEKLEALRRRMDGFVAAALGTPCSEWGGREVRVLEERPHVNAFSPQTVTLVPTDHDGPSIAIEVNGRPLTALLDTGSTAISMNARGFAHEHDGLEYVSWAPGISGLEMDQPIAFPLARLKEVRVGTETFERLLANVMEFHLDGEPVAGDQANIIGMNFMLKYRAVCFDWTKRLVHLGTIGPCAGVAPSTGRFSGPLPFWVQVEGARAQQAFALVDTGSDLTYCSEWFSQGRPHEFSFGSRSTLKGRCTFDEDIHFGDVDTGHRQVVMGMDMLLQFAAFGWELDPFRVYFVPKGTEETAPTSAEPVAEQPNTAWTVPPGKRPHRRGPWAEEQPEEVLTQDER